jgi:competence protein ComEA
MMHARLSTAALLLATLLVAASVSVARGEEKVVNVNTASAAELAGLKGIGDAKARAIIEYREKNGPFKSVDELRDVRGIGDKLLAQLRPSVTVGQPAAAAVAPAGAPAAAVKH